MRLREHSITLHGGSVTLRPMTEDDWDILLAWNSDPEVLYFSEGDDVAAYDLEAVGAPFSVSVMRLWRKFQSRRG